MLKAILTAAALLAIIPAATAGVDRETSAETLVTVAAQEIAQSDQDEIADAVLRNIDVPAIARFTLGRHGRTLDDATKTRFAEAFEAYLHRQIVTHADHFSGVEMTVTKTLERNDHDAVVTTVVERPEDKLTLRWRVIKRGGEWSVVDLEFAGIWLAIEQRAQISAILDRPGATIESVIEQLG